MAATKKERQKIIELFMSGGDNRSSVIASKLGYSFYKTDKVITEYLNQKIKKVNQKNKEK